MMNVGFLKNDVTESSGNILLESEGQSVVNSVTYNICRKSTKFVRNFYIGANCDLERINIENK